MWGWDKCMASNPMAMVGEWLMTIWSMNTSLKMANCHVHLSVPSSVLKYFIIFDNFGCPGQRFVGTRISTKLRGYATPYKHVYQDRRKALPWVCGCDGTRTSNHWGAHPRPDQLNYPRFSKALSKCVSFC